MSFSSLDWDILISSFQKILSSFINFPLWKTFEVWNCENMENTLKIKVFRKFCFANISATEARIFMKFYVVVNYYLVSVDFKFHGDLCTTTCARGVNPCTRDKKCACLQLKRVHLCTDLCDTWNLRSQDSNELSFMKIWAFVAEIFVKQYWHLLNLNFQYILHIFEIWASKFLTNLKIHETPWNSWKHNFKMLGSHWKKYTSPMSQLVFWPKYKAQTFFQSFWITLFILELLDI